MRLRAAFPQTVKDCTGIELIDIAGRECSATLRQLSIKSDVKRPRPWIGPASSYAGQSVAKSILRRLLRLERSTGPLRRGLSCDRATDDVLSTSAYRCGQTVEVPGALRLSLLPEGMAAFNAYAVKPDVPPLEIRN